MAEMSLPQYHAAQELEKCLGDPSDPDTPFSFRRALELDEMEAAPAEACRLLDEWGMNLRYVSQAEGGRLESFESALALGRVVSRRDLSATIEHAISFLGFTFVLIGGSAANKREAVSILARGGRIALGLTEREHGGDLAGSECEARQSDGAFLVSGEKWLINNATRGEAISCLVRTDPRGGPRGFSFLLIRKSVLAPGSFSLLPKVRTHGIRGVDISGIRFHEAAVSQDALLGPAGTGLEIALKGLQVTRTMCANLSLGAADTALRITLDFAMNRMIAGSSVWKIPAARAALVDAFADLLVCDCVSTAAARALHVMPGQMSVVSAVVKYFVPVTCENIVRSLAVVLGARHYLREEHYGGLFQKILRDIGIVSLFDGSTAVNLNIVAAQLPALCSADLGPNAERRDRIRQVFDLTEPLPPFDPSRIALHNSGRQDVMQSIADLDVPASAPASLAMAIARLRSQYEALRIEVSDFPGARESRGQTPEMFEFARRYCELHAAAACVLLWMHSGRALGEFFARGDWLALALAGMPGTQRRGSERESVAEELRERLARRMMFSLVPFRIAGGVQNQTA